MAFNTFTYNVATLKHSTGLCIEFISKFLKCETEDELNRITERASEILKLSNPIMMSPAPGPKLDSEKNHHLWNEFNQWVRLQVENIANSKKETKINFQFVNNFSRNYSIELSQYFILL